MDKEVILCEHAGFCFGANRGYSLVEESLNEGIPIYTYGPILNNQQIVDGFAKRGVRVVNSVEEFASLPKGKIIIRSHGVPRKTYEALQKTGFDVHDATCPFVKRIHRIVDEESKKGAKIVVVGNPKHPEVVGIVGWSNTPATVVETTEDVENFTCDDQRNICVVSQTTFNRTKFKELVDIFNKKGYNIHVMNTICDATAVRQEEAEKLATTADVMIVIGDKESSNSRKLYEICKRVCEVTYFIQTVDDIEGELQGISGRIGITAGASTPKYIIEEVQSHVREYDI